MFAGCGNMSRSATAKEWIDDCNVTEIKPGSIPSNNYIAVREDDNRIVGVMDLRLHINHPALSLWGGHIGYSIRPSERGKGYGKAMLAQVLIEARKTGLSKIMVTCSTTNKASEKVIIDNGGINEKNVEVDNEVIKRYWIDL